MEEKLKELLMGGDIQLCSDYNGECYLDIVCPTEEKTKKLFEVLKEFTPRKE